MNSCDRFMKKWFYLDARSEETFYITFYSIAFNRLSPKGDSFVGVL